MSTVASLLNADNEDNGFSNKQLFLEIIEDKSQLKPDVDSEEDLSDDEKIPIPIIRPVSPVLEKPRAVSPPLPAPVPERALSQGFVSVLDDLKQIQKLQGKSSAHSSIASASSSHKGKYSLPRRGASRTPPPETPIPQLKTLLKKTEVTVESAPEKSEGAIRRDLMYKLNRLRESNPSRDIPLFTMQSDIALMQEVYDDEIRQLTVKNTVNGYRKFLQIGFIAIEFVLGKYLKMPMKGFAKQEMLTMSSYDSLLTELGEKSYLKEDSKIPVELRLIGCILFNALIFAGTKMFTGAAVTKVASYASKVSDMATGASTDKRSYDHSVPIGQRTMRGPSF